MRETESKIPMSDLPAQVVDPQNPLCWFPVLCGGASRKQRIDLPGWRRTEDCHLLLVLQSGKIELSLDGQHHSLTGGSGFYLSPDARPDAIFHPGTLYHECYFKIAVLCRPRLAVAGDTQELVHPLHMIGESLQPRRAYLEPARSTSRFWLAAALAGFESRWNRTGKDLEKGRRLSANQRREVADWACARIQDHPKPAELAAHLRLRPDYFARLFKNTYGMPPRDWLAKQRIHKAIHLLEHSQLNITEIARELCYADPVHFCRKFKSVTGTSPLQYRKRLGAGSEPSPGA